MGWLKELFSLTHGTFYTYAMRNSRFNKHLSLKTMAEMHDNGQSLATEYKYATRLPNGMIVPPHSMVGEYRFLRMWCHSEGDVINREQLDIAFEKFGKEFSKENGYNYW